MPISLRIVAPASRSFRRWGGAGTRVERFNYPQARKPRANASSSSGNDKVWSLEDVARSCKVLSKRLHMERILPRIGRALVGINIPPYVLPSSRYLMQSSVT